MKSDQSAIFENRKAIEDHPTKSAQVTFLGKRSYTVEHVLETFLNMLSKNLALTKRLRIKSAHPRSALSSASCAN